MPMPHPPLVFVVVPVRDRRELTRGCLLALRAQTFQPAAVVVVDDGSSDGTPGMLAGEFPEVVVLPGSGDLWWTGATNTGCAWVLAHRRGEDAAVVTLNNDTVPPPDWLANLARAAAEQPGTLVGSLIVDADTGLAVHAGHYVDWWTARYSAPLRGLSVAEVRARAGAFLTTDFLAGNGTYLPLRALLELGPFDPALPQYGADYEFSRRAARNGWQLLQSTEAVLPVHAAETGLRVNPGAGVRDVARVLWSISSDAGLPYRVRFSIRACPPPALPSYLVLDALRVAGGRVRESLSGLTPDSAGMAQ
jgi:GT2 family glycosyltransferase